MVSVSVSDLFLMVLLESCSGSICFVFDELTAQRTQGTVTTSHAQRLAHRATDVWEPARVSVRAQVHARSRSGKLIHAVCQGGAFACDAGILAVHAIAAHLWFAGVRIHEPVGSRLITARGAFARPVAFANCRARKACRCARLIRELRGRRKREGGGRGGADEE